ncbi:MAG: hypothetical protein ACJAVR_000499 [Paracoccaceae bacterium]|jgi:uncharacterized protein (DUF1330 family)
MTETVNKGYWIAHVRVDDFETYKNYVEGARDSFVKYGAKFIVRGGKAQEIEGAIGRDRHVVIEFPSYQAAVDCWNSEGYQAARAHRLPVSEGTITIVEGA